MCDKIPSIGQRISFARFYHVHRACRDFSGVESMVKIHPAPAAHRIYKAHMDNVRN
jgi:hypothetical protein